MPFCAILNCRNDSRINNISTCGISYHRFPKVQELKARWIDATGRQKWSPSNTSTICSAHFRNEDFVIKKSNRKYIKDTAIPSQNILFFQFQIKEPSISNAILKEEQIDVIPDYLTKIVKKEPSLTSPIKSHDSIPREWKLEAIILNKENIIKQLRLQIRKIQAQNRRLRKKVNESQDLFRSLKKKTLSKHNVINTVQNTNLQIEETMDHHINADLVIDEMAILGP